MQGRLAPPQSPAPEKKTATSRRQMLNGAAVAAGAMSAPMIANAQTTDGGHGVVAYHYGKNSAMALWGSGPAFGMDPNMVRWCTLKWAPP